MSILPLLVTLAFIFSILIVLVLMWIILILPHAVCRWVYSERNRLDLVQNGTFCDT